VFDERLRVFWTETFPKGFATGGRTGGSDFESNSHIEFADKGLSDATSHFLSAAYLNFGDRQAHVYCFEQ